MQNIEVADKCRVCLQQRKVMHSLYSGRPMGKDGGSGSAPAEILASACGMRISQRDGEPSSICSACLRELDATSAFLRKCQRADRLLRTLIPPQGCQTEVKKFDGSHKSEDVSGCNSSTEEIFEHRMQIKSNRKCGEAASGGAARIKRERLTCEVCGRRVRSAGGLRAHLRLHSGERSHACHICDKTFAKKNNLAVHIRRHMQQRAFSCEVCGATHYTAHELRTHARTHTGARPHACAICGRTFTASNNLYIHQRTHTGEKPHECNICGKKFISSNILSIHRRIHTGEKPYVCPVCGKQFASNKLAVHARTHSGERPHACSLCGQYVGSHTFVLFAASSSPATS